MFRAVNHIRDARFFTNTHSMATTPRTEEYRDHLSTVDEIGDRIWVYPRQPKGKLHTARAMVAILLLSILVSTPFLNVGDQPVFLFNIFERRFILFGQVIFPQDFYLLGLLMVIFFVFIILFTVVFGRVWCGWACPQTIFMEMVFRKIEFWIEGDAAKQRALKAAPWTQEKILKKITKHAIFLCISLLIAHVLMAYLIGVEAVFEIALQSPAHNRKGFIGLLVFTLIFYFVFARLRELACTMICPYGRLQGVLLVKESIVVIYDFVRGEPRGKLKKKKSEASAVRPPKAHDHANCLGSCLGCPTAQLQKKEQAVITVQALLSGDCIDCSMCVQVCPTGIDIRNGTQLECINCTACIDACNAVMLKIGKPAGLIRFDSHERIEKKVQTRIFTTRVAAYSVVLLVLIGVFGFMLTGRSPLQATVMRVPGMLYQDKDGIISNLYNVQLVNKSADDMDLDLKVGNLDGTITTIGGNVQVLKGTEAKIVFFVEIPRQQLKDGKTSLTIEFYKNGKRITMANTTFLGPFN